MRRVCCSVLLIVYVGMATALAQDPAPDPKLTPGAQVDDGGMAVTGKPFSAVKYSRRVEHAPDGKLTIASEDNVMLVARDEHGLVRVDVSEGSVECDGLGTEALKKCPSRYVVLFDPTLGSIIHWAEGEIAAHVSLVIQLNAGQVEEARSSTLSIPDSAASLDNDGAIVTTIDLPGKRIDGVMATGVRTTAVVPAGHFGNKEPITRIHEVWTSKEMHMVVRVIDGDPSGKETIAGLEHISLAPDAALFRSPEGYVVEDRNQTEDESQYAHPDMEYLARWFVR